MTSLHDILPELSGVIATRGNVERDIAEIRYDSRQVERDDLFVAVNDRDDHGLEFVQDAVERGAGVVILDDPDHLPESTGNSTFVLVNDARRVMAEASILLYDSPIGKLGLYGVTGTNGKTTVAHVLRSLLSTQGKVGMIGTLGVAVDDLVPTGYTTPEAPELHRILHAMYSAGAEKVVMEVSSHGLALKRVDGLDFAGAIFTNITQDHLDFHTTFQDYFNAKKSLFDRLDASATAVVNIDDIHGTGMVRDSDATIVRYGHRAEADLCISDTDLAPDGSTWVIRFSEQLGGGTMTFRTGLAGAFNVSNITAACGMALAAGLDRNELPELVEKLQPVPGRMESIPLPNGAIAIVDYAHTPDALENLMRAVRQTNQNGTLRLIFGCGGDRDRGKRPLMGEIAARLSDRVYLTSDNPRSEDPATIMNQIVEGISQKNIGVVTLIHDRRKAIEQALSEAGPSDTIVVAGKGHETVQIIGSEKLPFDDREVIKEWSRGEEVARN